MPDHENITNGTVYKGAIRVELCKPRGMITLKGDLTKKSFDNGLVKALGLSLPKAKAITVNGDTNIVWMAHDEVLILVNFMEVGKYMKLLEINLKGEHYLLANVSDARVIFNLKGKDVREVLAKGTPVNMEMFQINEARRSRVGQLPTVFWMIKNNEMELVCFRSVAEFMFNWLKVSSAPNSLPAYFE